MKKSDLDEGYGIVLLNTEKLKREILFVFGKQITEHCAITYNDMNEVYTLTVIKTGCAVHRCFDKTLSNKFVKQFRETAAEFEKELSNSEEYRDGYEKGKKLYNKLIAEKEFYKNKKK